MFNPNQNESVPSTFPEGDGGERRSQTPPPTRRNMQRIPPPTPRRDTPVSVRTPVAHTPMSGKIAGTRAVPLPRSSSKTPRDTPDHMQQLYTPFPTGTPGHMPVPSTPVNRTQKGGAAPPTSKNSTPRPGSDDDKLLTTRASDAPGTATKDRHP